MIRLWRALCRRVDVWSLVLLALVPSLASSPGRMPADTKLFLYLDPGRLVADARWSWDARQFGGWVPHQTISYLWPSGPWYAVWDAARVPDWVAHRLWLATLMVTAGLGVRWAARLLGLGVSAAWVAGAVYQLSPFILPYVSRTSLMLVTYSALGWLVGLTIRSATRGGWRDAAAFALVVATVAAPNATATAMIAPAPLLWLLTAAASRELSWRRALQTAGTLGGLSLAVSTWWIAMLVVQGRHGADVLGYSETLEDVSLTATSTEVLRGLGYWLFYVRDAFEYATTSSIDYQASTRTLVTSLLVTGVGLAGLALTRWTARRYAIALVAVGVLLAVGVHPIDDPSALMSPLADRSRSVLALALRSSTRAVPLVVFGLALGAGALVTVTASWWAQRRQRPSPPRWPAVAVVLVAFANMPALWRADLVDPALERDQDPPVAWQQAAALLDQRPRGFRVLQVPGAEFGAFRWGYTVDPPLPGLTNRPLVTRDLLPLGSPAAMDLLYAFDDRIQDGVLEPEAVAPVARLLGADVIWLSNDAAFDRFGTARPEPLADLLTRPDSGLGTVTAVGDPQVNRPARPALDAGTLAQQSVGQPRPPVELVDVPRPVPIMRAGTDVIVVAGSGDGLVDAAAAGLLDNPGVIRYAASIHDRELSAVLADARRVVVTDTDRRRAHHWRSSQEVWGFTEDAGPDGGVLEPATGDRRLPLFPDDASDQQTIARQVGGLRAGANRYGPPFSYRPELRAWRAVDGDLSSAWLVAHGVEATGARLRLTSPSPVDHLEVVQPLDPHTGRWITALDVSVDGTEPVHVPLDERSRTQDGQRIDLPRPGTVIDLVVRATQQRGDGWEHMDPVGFAEVRSDRSGTDETVVLRSPVLAATPATTPMDLVMTRWRVSPHDAARSDPEPTLDRSFTLGSTRSVEPHLTVRLDRRADDTTIARLLGWEGAVADRRLPGDVTSGGWAALDGDPATAWRTPFDAAVGARWSVPLDVSASRDADVGSPDELLLTQVLDDHHALITELDVIVDDHPPVTLAVPAPDSDGVSRVVVGPVLADRLADPSSRRLTLQIRSTDGATTLDPTTARPMGLPAGLTSVGHPRLTTRTFPDQLSLTCRDDLVDVDGQPFPVRLEGDLPTLVQGVPLTVTPCGATTLTLSSGDHRLRTLAGRDTGLDVDRVVLTDPRVATAGARPAVEVLDESRGRYRVRVAACPTGCWLVHGEGYNTGWTASGPDGSLGVPTLVDGGFNGWWLEPSGDHRVVDLRWTPQRLVDVGLGISLFSVAVCAGLVVFGRRGRPQPTPSSSPTWWSWQPAHRTWSVRTTVALTLFTLGSMVAITPAWGLVAGAVALGAVAVGRPALMGVSALAVAGVLGAIILWRVRRDRPFPGPLWTAEFADLHRPGLVLVALLVGSLMVTGRDK